MKGTGAKRNVCPGSCVSTGRSSRLPRWSRRLWQQMTRFQLTNSVVQSLSDRLDPGWTIKKTRLRSDIGAFDGIIHRDNGTKFNASYTSYFSMASTHRHRPSQAVDAIFIFSASKSGLLQKRARICFITGAGMLSCSQHSNMPVTMEASSFLVAEQITVNISQL